MNAFTTPTEMILALVLAVVLSTTAASAREDIDPGADKDHKRPAHGSLGNIGAKLADPTSNVWALSFNIQGPTFYDGDLNATTTRPRRGNGTSPSGSSQQG